jgi:uncharacterized protein
LPMFVADCMLGKLAKWLRILGFDTVFIHDASDDELVRLAVREDRILLTKDHMLAERRLIRTRCLFVTEEGTGAQLRQVVRNLALNPDESHFFTRCSVCNSAIVEIPRQNAEAEAPPYVYQTQERFGRCEGCRRLYWRGTHVEHVMEALRERKRE